MKPGTPDTLAISQPTFDTQKITTSVTLDEGQPEFLGNDVANAAQGAANGGGPSEIWLAFLNVSLVNVPAGKAKAPANPVNSVAGGIRPTAFIRSTAPPRATCWWRQPR